MKFYFDTNVIVAAAVTTHPQHSSAMTALRSINSLHHSGVIAAHGLAEIYSVLTRAPYSPSVHPREAIQIVEDNVSRNFTIVSLSALDYRQVLRQAAQLGVAGGRVYDMLHIHAAEKSACDRLYTFNLRHFESLAPDLKAKIVSP